ncbi:IucA/IucC family protein [Chitinophaga nivalis]|uniref:IucA/IucC family siderophore biosynthesis protein n=1 Tax=Chitinophaga nivalis TaxID=2991709 RepID=A0ABT3IKQ8_9BACT|nr:IucA/IucC family siderophore biosynthesis protein [Chitinophaga nivalis]MCW3465768.1 IucA/IucC family siderophore biosynthesis protein [Chitinophaga nivalis]MCW3484541.1 IucA/IucC family siderophore biosynthesis protein [Chitinophaga nivalis]
MNNSVTITPEQAIAHLQPEVWLKVNTLHIRKALTELSHELLLTPLRQYTKDGWGHYELPADKPGVVYRFRAQILQLDHWYIDTTSIEKLIDQVPAPLDSLQFIAEFTQTLGIDEDTLPKYMEEICSVLYGSAYMHTKPGFTSEELVHADYQQVEHAMMEGHPAFIANNGRIGFDATDYRAYAPEADAPVHLLWIAGHQSRAAYTGITALPYQQLLQQELGDAVLASFNQKITDLGLNPADYVYLPVHPWQWYNKLVHIFGADIANRQLIFLGTSEDAYLAQQSIRTFFNISHPEKFYVKTALSILNMGFMRGLSPYYMRTTPAITEWISQELGEDAYLQEKGFSLLAEVATVGYRHLYYEMAQQKDSPYKKMLAALWRESPVARLQPGQQLMTMASLLHIDREGKALLPALIKASGTDATTWLRSYIDAYLSPILHCFYYHDIVFMPHGENLILILENSTPVKAIMKDITEEIGVLSKEKVLPAVMERLSVVVPDEYKLIYIFTDIFDDFFRYVAHILVEHAGYPEDNFWELVAACILAYQERYPELAEKFERHDLFAPEFHRCCLNRLQLRHHQQMINLSDPIGNLQFAGMLKNPIAVYKTKLAGAVPLEA